MNAARKPPPHVGVAGAGIAGLSVALSLRDAGIGVTVYERAADARSVQVGGALTMFPNAVRAMDLLGVGDEVRDAGADFEAAEFRRADGSLLARWPVGDMGRRHGGSAVFIRRGQLHQFLFAALSDDVVVTGSEVVGFEERTDDVAVQLADGREETCDVLVGADGLASRVRTLLYPGTEAFYSGYTGWHGEIPRGDLPPNILRALFGRGDRFVFYPADRDDLSWHAVANAPEGEQDPPGEAKARLLARFDGWPEPTIAMIERTAGDRIRRADTYAGPVLRRWTKGRVTLAGDAAHPTTFNVGQGAAQAMEDGVVLARCLAATPDPVAALRDYESRRRKRAASFQRLAYRTGRMAALEGRLSAAVRDVVMRQVLNGVGRRQVERETAAYRL